MNNGKVISIAARNRLYLNLCNLVFFLIVAFTGSVIQIQYHMHRLPEACLAMGLDKAGWSQLHKVSAVVFFAGLLVHCLVNWRFVAISTRRIFEGKFATLLSHAYLLFLVSAVSCFTAMTSWILFGGEERARFVLVEIHDKFGWLLLVFGLIHFLSRSGRMIGSLRKARVETGINTNRTEYIRFDSKKCKACWKCIEACPKDVFGKINLLIHKHVTIRRRDNCIGCLKCLKACSHTAIVRPVVVCQQ